MWLTVPERTRSSRTVRRRAGDQDWTEGLASDALKCSATSLSHQEQSHKAADCGGFATDGDFFCHYFDALLWMSMNTFILELWCSA